MAAEPRVPHLDQARGEGPGQASSWRRSSPRPRPGSPPASTGDPAPQATRWVLPLPAKLADCRASDNERTELFIVEGDSALGTAKPARNAEFQALLPIRGKILNVQKASVGDMLKNAECASIIQVVGAGSGRTFDLDARRYGRIFMADADSDGAHIRTLLATLFFHTCLTWSRPGLPPSPLHLHRASPTPRRPGEVRHTYSGRRAAAQARRS